MTYFYPLPHTAYKFRHQPIDDAPLTARFTALMGLFSLFVTLGRSREMLSISRRIARTVKAYVKVATHNAHMERKLEMLLNPAWRTRVLDDLGGLDALYRWDEAVTRAELRRDGCWIPKRQPAYKDPEPVWWRTPERIAESERLKAHKRDCARACANPLTVRDPYKMDRDGLFRLAPLPRVRSKDSSKREPVIYSAQTIGEYNFNAAPVYQPKGLGAAPVWPIEFYTAIGVKLTYERRQYEEMDLSGQPALTIEDKAIEQTSKETSLFVTPPMTEGDHSDLISFIGEKNYDYIFENPI